MIWNTDRFAQKCKLCAGKLLDKHVKVCTGEKERDELKRILSNIYQSTYLVSLLLFLYFCIYLIPLQNIYKVLKCWGVKMPSWFYVDTCFVLKAWRIICTAIVLFFFHLFFDQIKPKISKWEQNWDLMLLNETKELKLFIYLFICDSLG